MQNQTLTLTQLEREAVTDLEAVAAELTLLARQAKREGVLSHYPAIQRCVTDINSCHMVIARRPLDQARANPDTDWSSNDTASGHTA